MSGYFHSDLAMEDCLNLEAFKPALLVRHSTIILNINF